MQGNSTSRSTIPSELSQDVLTHLFSFCSREALQSAVFVSTSWRSAATRNEFWCRIKLDQYESETENDNEPANEHFSDPQHFYKLYIERKKAMYRTRKLQRYKPKFRKATMTTQIFIGCVLPITIALCFMTWAILQGCLLDGSIASDVENLTYCYLPLLFGAVLYVVLWVMFAIDVHVINRFAAKRFRRWPKLKYSLIGIEHLIISAFFVFPLSGVCLYVKLAFYTNGRFLLAFLPALIYIVLYAVVTILLRLRAKLWFKTVHPVAFFSAVLIAYGVQLALIAVQLDDQTSIGSWAVTLVPSWVSYSLCAVCAVVGLFIRKRDNSLLFGSLGMLLLVSPLIVFFALLAAKLDGLLPALPFVNIFVSLAVFKLFVLLLVLVACGGIAMFSGGLYYNTIGFVRHNQRYRRRRQR